MQSETNTKAEIITLLEGRPQVSLKKIHQFILENSIISSSCIPPTLTSPKNLTSTLLKPRECLKT